MISPGWQPQQRAGAGHSDQHGGVERADGDGQIAGVLGEFRLPLRALALKCFKARDHHPQQLRDDGCGDVGHDAQGEYGDLQHRPAGEHVDEGVGSALGITQRKAALYAVVAHARCRDECLRSDRSQ